MSFNNVTKNSGSIKTVPDAWNDDWEPTVGKPQYAVIGQDLAKTAKFTNKTTLLARPSGSNVAGLSNTDDLAPHMQNLQLWNQANTTTAFEVVSTTSSQPTKTIYRPELKILKRSASNSPSIADKSKQANSANANEAEEEDELKETPQEKAERLRKEREARYNKVREQIFGSEEKETEKEKDKEITEGVLLPLEKIGGTKSGKTSGTSTPTTNGKGNNNQNRSTPARKTSPSNYNKQNRRKDRDDDFVPRSAMVAGTLETYQMDQQMQAEARIREQMTMYPMYPQYGHPAGNLVSNNYPSNPQAFPQPNSSASGTLQFMTRTLPGQAMKSGPAWDTYPQMGQQPFHQQFPGHQYPQQPYQQHQSPYNHPYHNAGPPTQSQVPPPQNILPQHYQQLKTQQSSQQQLYDPLYPSSGVPSHLQFQPQQQLHQQHTPIREPRIPDGSGANGFGFAGRGGAGGNSFNRNMNSTQNPSQTADSHSSGFNSAAAAAPWGATAVNGNDALHGQIWSGPNQSHLQNQNSSQDNTSYSQNHQQHQHQHQQQPQQTSHGLPLNSLGNGGIWGGSSTWQR